MNLLNHPGAKSKLASWIISHFPKHEIYVEPYAGGASVIFDKPPSKTEVLNDINVEICNFLEVLRTQPDRLYELVELTPYSPAPSLPPTDDPVERARRYWHEKNTSWNNDKGYYYNSQVPSSAGGTLAGAWGHKRSNILVAGKRLAMGCCRVEIMNALECIQKYDGPKTLFYVDPPYLATNGERKRNLYKHEMMGEEDHIRLAEVLKACKGYVVLSGYPTALYAELYAGWEMRLELIKPRSKETKLEALWIKPHDAPKLIDADNEDLFGERTASKPKQRCH